MSFLRKKTFLQRERDKGANRITSTTFIESGDDGPITLDEAKAHLVITFTDDDVLIADMLKSAISSIEKYCCISIHQKEVTIRGDIQSEFALPYCPFLEMETAKIRTGINTFRDMVQNTDFEINGDVHEFVNFIPFVPGRIMLTYSTGYDSDSLPADLKRAVLNELSFRYENRGDAAELRANVDPGVCASARVLANPYVQMSWP